MEAVSILITFLTCKLLAGPYSEKPEPSNLIIITADDLGLQLSCYNDDIIETPNIDNLAERGIRFTNAYVTQASCSPSRSSILTATYPHTNGQIGLAHGDFWLNKKYPNLPASLKKEGYKNGIIGKLHVHPDNLDQPLRLHIFPFDSRELSAQQTRDVELVASKAEEFIKSAGDTPFFLYINYFDPHVPLITQYEGHPAVPVNPDDVHAFDFQGVDDQEELERIAGYYSCVRRLDEGIGILFKKLDSMNVLENTLIIFVGDNGPPFTRAKTSCYESSVRIPFILYSPALKKTGISSSALISTVDIFPTVMDMLGFDTPDGVQGKSLVPVLHDHKTEVRKYLYTEFTHHGSGINSYFPRRTIRDDRFKLIVNLCSPALENGLTSVDEDMAYQLSRKVKYDGTWVREVFDRLKAPPEMELYDLANDPFEKNNLANDPKFKDKLEELRSQLYSWLSETGDPFIDEEYLREYTEKQRTE